MPDDVEPISLDKELPAAPTRQPLPPGQFLSYSTQGPSDFTSNRTVPPPQGGLPAVVPGNAMNVATGMLPVPSPEQRQMEEMRRMYGNLPVPQAMERIKAATQLQAIWGYKHDVANGVAPNEAFAKWAPLGLAGAFGGATKPGTAHVFQNPHTGAIGQVDPYGNYKELKPGTPQPLHVGGGLYDPVTYQPLIKPKAQPSVGAKALAKQQATDLATELSSAESTLKSIPQTVKEAIPGSGLIFKDKRDVPNPAYAAQQAKVKALKKQLVEIDPTVDVTGAPEEPKPTEPPKEESFDTEDAARKSGKKKGDVIRLKGVGKVRLG